MISHCFVVPRYCCFTSNHSLPKTAFSRPAHSEISTNLRRGRPETATVHTCIIRNAACATPQAPRSSQVVQNQRILVQTRPPPALGSSGQNPTERGANAGGRENPITWNLELTLPDKRGVGNQICWNKARFFKYTGTNAFSRIQKGAIPQDGIRAKTRRFPTYQDSSQNPLAGAGL